MATHNLNEPLLSEERDSDAGGGDSRGRVAPEELTEPGSQS